MAVSALAVVESPIACPRRVRSRYALLACVYFEAVILMPRLGAADFSMADNAKGRLHDLGNIHMPTTESRTTAFGAILNRGMLLAWVLAIGAGLLAMTRYESTSGRAGAAPHAWPDEIPLQTQSGRATLVMLAHPRCPCTRASIAELSELMAQEGSAITAYVLFYTPSPDDREWADSANWRSARAIPGVDVRADLHGTLARRFGASTSGQVFLYDQAGHLIFDGGITGARGHAGENAGRNSVIELVRRSHSEVRHTPVFGCPLLASSSACEVTTCPEEHP